MQTLITDTSAPVSLVTLFSQRAALKLEIAGMRHSSGRSISAHLKKVYGWKGDKVSILAQLTALIESNQI